MPTEWLAERLFTCIRAAVRSPWNRCATNHPFVEAATSTPPSRTMHTTPIMTALARLDITIAIVRRFVCVQICVEVVVRFLRVSVFLGVRLCISVRPTKHTALGHVYSDAGRLVFVWFCCCCYFRTAIILCNWCAPECFVMSDLRPTSYICSGKTMKLFSTATGE